MPWSGNRHHQGEWGDKCSKASKSHTRTHDLDPSMWHGTRSHTHSQSRWRRHPLRNVVWASKPPELGKIKGSVSPTGFPRMHQEGERHAVGGNRDGGGRPPIGLASTGFSQQGCGHQFGPLISAWQVVPPGLRWIQQGEGVNHDDSTMRETEGAEMGPRN